jgi:hypothetical protein
MALDSYDILPKEMRAYLRNYGYSFSKRACEYAVSKMNAKILQQLGVSQLMQ